MATGSDPSYDNSMNAPPPPYPGLETQQPYPQGQAYPADQLTMATGRDPSDDNSMNAPPPPYPGLETQQPYPQQPYPQQPYPQGQAYPADHLTMATGSDPSDDNSMNTPPPPYPGLETQQPYPQQPYPQQPFPQGQGQYPGPPLTPVQQFGPDSPEQNTVHVVQPVEQVIVVRSFGSLSTPIRCQYCNHDVMTVVRLVTGSYVWLISGLLFLFGCWFGCCCLTPFCIDEFKDVKHYCPNCKALLGSYKRMRKLC